MKIPGVKLSGEYAQLADLVEIAYWEDRRLVDTLEDAAFPLLGWTLVEWREYLYQRLWAERRRREDIIFWLYQDSLLRQQGTNYPDEYEAYTPPKPYLEDEF